MDWIKVPTDNVLYSEYKDSELIVLIKYQALYCQLEVEPSDVQLKRIFNKKQRDFLRSNAEVVQKLIKSQIKVVTTKRNRDKDNYQRKQQLSKNSASGTLTESLRTGVAEKRREEKNKKDTKVSKKGSRFDREKHVSEVWYDEAKRIKPFLSKTQIDEILDGFNDYWVGVSGANGTKLDWTATWRNWVRRQNIKTAIPKQETVEERMRRLYGDEQ